MSEYHPFPFATTFRADRAGGNLAGDTERFRRNSRAPEPSSVVGRSFCREVSHDSGENPRPNSTFYTTPHYVIPQERIFAGSARALRWTTWRATPTLKRFPASS